MAALSRGAEPASSLLKGRATSRSLFRRGNGRLMPRRESHKAGSELFIVDNSAEEWKALRYLHDWCQLSKSIDIATGYFEIAALLAIGDERQKVDHIRVLMGDEVSMRTKRAFEAGLREISSRLDRSIEQEKEQNYFLKGVPTIVEAIRAGKIECRVYRKDKFHAKAYITHARLSAAAPPCLPRRDDCFALDDCPIGSSSFPKIARKEG